MLDPSAEDVKARVLELTNGKGADAAFECAGETDDYCYNIVKDPMDVHDLHATILHCMGVDHTKLTFKFQGRHFRLTDVKGSPVRQIMA